MVAARFLIAAHFDGEILHCRHGFDGILDDGFGGVGRHACRDVKAQLAFESRARLIRTDGVGHLFLEKLYRGRRLFADIELKEHERKTTGGFLTLIRRINIWCFTHGDD